MARFRASVAFFVKTTRMGSDTPRRRAVFSRASRTIRAAAMERRWAERPGLPPISRLKRSMAR
jgi:hypothetical protein